ncbi:hypothetical protein BH23PLA1_BH23PLA1_40150 [soil metagenome]
MSKLDALRRTAGGNIAESAARRDAPVIAASTLAAISSARMEGVARSKAALEIPLDKIHRDPTQPREEFDEEALARLAESIRTRGLLQPVRVRWSEEQGRYLLIAGERRWRAARIAGLNTLTCIVAEEELPPADLLVVQVTENLQREDLRPIERAKAFRSLIDLTGWSGNQLARELGISQSSVVHALSLLELPEDLQGRVERGDIAPSVGYELSKLDDSQAQAEVADRIIKEGLTRGEAVQTIRQMEGRPKTGKAKKGRGGKPRKITSRTFRLVNGYKVTVDRPAGIEPETLAAALEQALAMVRSEITSK